MKTTYYLAQHDGCNIYVGKTCVGMPARVQKHRAQCFNEPRPFYKFWQSLQDPNELTFAVISEYECPTHLTRQEWRTIERITEQGYIDHYQPLYNARNEIAQ